MRKGVRPRRDNVDVAVHFVSSIVMNDLNRIAGICVTTSVQDQLLANMHIVSNIIVLSAHDSVATLECIEWVRSLTSSTTWLVLVRKQIESALGYLPILSCRHVPNMSRRVESASFEHGPTSSMIAYSVDASQAS